MVARLGDALIIETWSFIESTFNFFTAAMAQGVLHSFYRVFIPKSLQRGFGTRYLILRSLLHLDVH